MIDGINIIETTTKSGQPIVLFVITVVLAIILSATMFDVGIIVQWKKKKKVDMFGILLALCGVIIGVSLLQMSWLECNLPTTTHTVEISDTTPYVEFLNTYEIVSENNGQYEIRALKEIATNDIRMRASSIWCITLLGGWFIALMFFLGIDGIIRVFVEKDEIGDKKKKELIFTSVSLIVFAMLCTYGLVWCWQNLNIAPETIGTVGPYEAVNSAIYQSSIDGVSIVGVADYGDVAVVLAVLLTIFSVVLIIDTVQDTKKIIAKIKITEDNKNKSVLKVKCVAGIVLTVAFVALSAIVWCVGPYSNQTHYIATIDKSVSFNEFVEKYTVVEFDGELYEIAERPAYD